MHEVEQLLIFPQKLDKAGIEYMITGSVAGIMYGHPRLTHDIDLVVHLQEPHIQKLAAIFPDNEFYCPPPEVIRLEMQREVHGHFNIIHYSSGQKAVFYPLVDDLHRWAFAQRRQEMYKNQTVCLAPPEYVILRKLQFYRAGGSDKHRQDVAHMLATSNLKIDMNVLCEKIKSLQLETTWDSWKL